MKIKLSCGHTEDRQIPSELGACRQTVDKLQAFGVCRKCAEFRSAVAQQQSEFVGLPALEGGTPKQRAFAASIRYTFYKNVIGSGEDNAEVAAALNYLKNVKNTGLWLATRSPYWKETVKHFRKFFEKKARKTE